jgi:hypothetical protein
MRRQAGNRHAGCFDGGRSIGRRTCRACRDAGGGTPLPLHSGTETSLNDCIIVGCSLEHVERGDMGFCEGLVKYLGLAVLAAWAGHAALLLALDSLARVALQADDGASVPALSDDNGPNVELPAMVESICPLVEEAAQAHGLPLEFFTRLIWQESRFNPGAIGPLTRSGQRAQGIAQFMPDTAKERGAFDPFDPVAALPKSAEFLRDLRGQFGNLGLAAAAYNAGPKRVRDWLAGRSSLPGQTRNYVSAITGRNADDWAALTRRSDDSRDPAPEKRSCNQLIAQLKAEPVLYADDSERRTRTATRLL